MGLPQKRFAGHVRPIRRVGPSPRRCWLSLPQGPAPPGRRCRSAIWPSKRGSSRARRWSGRRWRAATRWWSAPVAARSPAGSVRAGTDSHRNDSVQRVLVLNGGRATVRLSQWLPLRSAEWVWAGRGSGAGSSTVWVDIGQGLSVRPAWPGGNQPVRAEVAVESTARDDTRGAVDRQRPAGADASLPRLSVSTELALPLGEWVTVAQLFDDSDGTARGSVAGGSGGGVVSSTRTLRREQTVQLRITAP